MKKIILCADDFGQNAAISEGIIKLVEQGRLSAVSCMVTTDDWLVWGEKLKPFAGKIDIGWHINLTHGDAADHIPTVTEHGTFPGLKKLLLKSMFGLINSDAVLQELHVQLQRFQQVMGKLPDFIDGHQHVHQLAGVRDAVLQLYQSENMAAQSVYCRSILNMNAVSQRYKRKVRVMQFFGARAWQRMLVKHRIPHNKAFGGVYDFIRDPKNYVVQAHRWLNILPSGGVIMCHPGLQSDDDHDPISATRWMEYQFYASDTFAKLLHKYQVELARFLD